MHPFMSLQSHGPEETVTGEKSDMEQNELLQKNAALWLHYSNISMGMNVKSTLLDNGACIARVPVSLKYPSDNHDIGMDKKERSRTEVTS